MKTGYVYIITNPRKTVLYVGVTSQLYTRILQHKQKVGSKFASKYKCRILVYWEFHNCILEAIHREKRIKKWNRKWKENLIESKNPNWSDLWTSIEGVD